MVLSLSFMSIDLTTTGQTQSPLNTEGKRGGQSEVSLWFCADPAPSNVYWKFGSIQLDAMK